MYDPQISFEDATAPVVPDAVAQAQAHIDKELEALVRRMGDLRSQRNTLSRISSLPPELLAAVFVQYARQSFSETHQPSYYNPKIAKQLMWTKVTHVCRHWRQVALSCPALWTFLVFTSSPWLKEMLVRSKMAPLVIDVDLARIQSDVEDAVAMALEHSTRVRDLRLVAPKGVMEGLFAPLTAPAPLLESFTVSNKPGTINFALPTTLFGGEAPRLRKIELFKCDIAWPAPLLVDLVHLDINYLDAGSRPTMKQLLSSLGRMPALHTLLLEDALPPVPLAASVSSTVGSDPQVALSALTRLHLGGSVLECADLLRRLSYPSGIALSLKCKAPTTLGVDFSCLFPFISGVRCGTDDSSSPSVEAATFRSVVICGGHRSALIRCSTSDTSSVFNWPSSDKDHWARGAHLALDISWQTPCKLGPISSICRVLPLSNVQTIYVDRHTELPEAFWLDGLSGARGLRSLFLTGSDVSGLVKALARDGPEAYNGLTGTTQTETIFAPALTALELEDVEFDETHDVVMGFRGAKPTDLRDALIVRANQGVDLQKLGMSNCRHVFEEDVDLLEEVVVDFKWDGIERYDGDSDDEGEDDEDMYYGDGLYGAYDSDEGGSLHLGW
ncbi:hypothetical protein BV22DRAFT_244612 [Leucogyrophana mollusca]|uniref:Uncharacterized protein n=1 Tax=Leucogyrophana mollusca TaxID=85980 RepID=A0ACB8BRZ4_9AGAM|nr:hypothetical protein BV22DRAFT_244612 [Leucogyrophana mollusca]